MITLARWQEAQRYEAEYWAKEAKDQDKLRRDIADGHRFTAALLDLVTDDMYNSVIDIAGGDYPLGLHVKVHRYTVVDPAERAYVPDNWTDIKRVRQMAEDYDGAPCDEVWGYNVLQHVLDPARVMATARRCALKTIRWFDVVDTPIYPVHPHSISADWLRGQFKGFRIVRDIDGSRLIDGHRQKFIALVAERNAGVRDG